MKVLLVGSGGREHALAWKLAQSPRLAKLWVAPGNAGTGQVSALGSRAAWPEVENISIRAEDREALLAFARRQAVDLVVVGPEGPLAAGLADDLRAAGVAVFGPSRAAAQIEASKAFAKAFMARHGIPTARSAAFSDYAAAREYLHRQGRALPVLKASGLASGKGVVLPESLTAAEEALYAMMVSGELGSAGEEVVMEERLSGQEVSLLAFTDGVTVKAMPPAQDYKRLLDDDGGPNTGGMGACAPVPICPPDVADEMLRAVLQPAVDGLRAEGNPFVGVLYAGMMLTADGPRVLEFNCRFGDPETQAILPLLETDLLTIFQACVDGRLDEVDIRWKKGAAACVVLASQGYPGKYATGHVINGLETLPEHTVAFHAGTKLSNGQVVTAGGRVLGITATGETLKDALERAYTAIARVNFAGMHYRRDIGKYFLRGDIQERPKLLYRDGESPQGRVGPCGPASPASAGGSSLSCTEETRSVYAAAGVSIDAGDRAVELMAEAVRSTYGREVLAGIGAFGGLFDAAALQRMRHPVLVGSTDGVGTKVKLAAQVGRYRSIGHDIVNHCIDDILVQGARPLFFLDYFATSRLTPEIVAEVVTGIAEACRAADCALLGGETAEMPGVYAEGEFDVAGTIIGIVEKEAILPRTDLQAGDVLIGLRSSGPHTNGYSLIRKIFAGVSLETVFPELGVPLADALLAPHRSYLSLIQPILHRHPTAIKALAHLTGGGFIENIPRILPQGVGAVVQRGSWPIPPLFELLQRQGDITSEEMHRVFNMGIGLIIVAAPEDAAAIQSAIAEESWIVGQLIAGERKVTLL